MKNTAYIILSIILTIMVCSCETTIPFEGDFFIPKYAMNGLILADNPIVISLSKSSFDPEANADNCTDAEVLVYEDDQLIGTMDYCPEDSLYWTKLSEYNHTVSPGSIYMLNDYKAQYGKEYKIRVNISDGTQLSAKTSIPAPIAIDSISYKIESYSDWGEQSYGIFTYIYFTDPSETKDYYRIIGEHNKPTGYISQWIPVGEDEMCRIKLMQNDEEIYPSYFESPALRSNDDGLINFSGSNDYNAMSDEYFEGGQHFIKVKLVANIDPERLIRQSDFRYEAMGLQIFYQGNFFLHTITESLYQYYQTVDAHLANDGDIFVEPVQVYSNIENGVGIFSGDSESFSSIIIGEKPDTANVVILTKSEYDDLFSDW